MGVCPRGAQVRLSGETSEKPLSSSKISVACSWRHFFYLWPDVPFPVRDGFVIALQSPALRSLAAPAQALQQVPDGTRMVPYAKQLPAQVRHAVKGPIVFGVPMGIRAALQGLL